MKKIVTVIGARPQFIKAATVSRQLRDMTGVREVIVHTGQHYESNMSQVFFTELEIPEPHYNLGIGGGLHGEMTGQQLIGIEAILLGENPDSVLVYGDTNSTLAGALAAIKLHMPVAHVEAGLRSYNREMPEEVNRVLTDHMSEVLFTPTAIAVQNLEKEGIVGARVCKVGDVMFDAMLHYRNRADKESRILNELDLCEKEFTLATVHRPSNTDNKERLTDIIRSFQYSPKPVLLPLHPRTKKKLDEYKVDMHDNVRIIPPVGYLDMVMLEKNAYTILTDSGGVQKEAYFNNVPCITLREETEWQELVDNRKNMLTGADIDKITDGFSLHWYKSDESEQCLYGLGDAAERIARTLSS